MAEVRFSQDEFMCTVCLDLLKDPVTIQCGHSYCKSCITGCWDKEDQMRVYSCPQCKQTFSPRPALARNTMLSELVEKLKKTKRPADCYAGAGDLCTKYEHKNHNTVSAAAQRTEKQVFKTSNQRIQQREKDPQQLREAVESHKRSAQTAVEDSERIFTELIRSIERRFSELIRLIRDQEKAAVSRAEGRLERLEQEINDLRRRDAELEQLSHTQDHLQFLQVTETSAVGEPKTTDSKSAHQLRDKLEDFCKEELKKISEDLHRISDSHQFTLDLNTVNKRLQLSESNRVVTDTDTVQPYPDHPERFDSYSQVLCRESVCGRCYWELEWTGDVRISVSYKSISRKGRGYECLFGYNDQSWSLDCSSSNYSFGHNNVWTRLHVKPISSRIGVFVDHSSGTLSLYSVSDTMSLILILQTTFTQPLYPGFAFGFGSSVKLC
uniref:Tripartite motif-containing protein 16-like n=1 Tax=Sinocyclocheilus rhinocerous TaxID=307959 RepID=A0A673GAE9_9TELE